MFTFPSYIHSTQELSGQSPTTPLLSWDTANPALTKRTQIAEDMYQVEQLQTKYKWQLDLNFKKLLSNNYILVVTNISKEIEWTSQEFQYMTGYSRAEVIGRKPTFLQGEKTSPKNTQLVREKLANFEVAETRLLNYRKEGTPYWCQVAIYPIRNTEGVFTHFIAVEKELD